MIEFYIYICMYILTKFEYSQDFHFKLKTKKCIGTTTNGINNPNELD